MEKSRYMNPHITFIFNTKKLEYIIYCRLRNNKTLVTIVLTSVLLLYILVNSKGPHHDVVQGFYKKLLWCLYWIGLGKKFIIGEI